MMLINNCIRIFLLKFYFFYNFLKIICLSSRIFNFLLILSKSTFFYLIFTTGI